MACAPSTTPALTLEFEGETVHYAQESADGEPVGATFATEAGQVFPSTQTWSTTEIEGPRSTIQMGFGSAIDVAAMTNSGIWLFDADGTQFAGSGWRVDQVIPTGNPEQPVLYAGPLDGDATGTLSMGPWCGEGEGRNVTGCGFPVPEGTTEAEIDWPGLELVPQTDGCSTAAWSEQLAAGAWSWSGDTLTVSNGQPFDCVLTPLDELVCTATWTHESAYGNLAYSESSCPFEITAVLWPDIAGTGATPAQTHAYWHVMAKERFTFDIAEQCLGGEAACIAFH